jgi:hypothetical protein
VIIEGFISTLFVGAFNYSLSYVHQFPFTERCHDYNQEVSHWQSVLGLHRTYYFPEDPAPFLIPPPSHPSDPIDSSVLTHVAPIIPQTPSSDRMVRVDPTYTSSTFFSDTASSPPTSPIRATAAPSGPTKVTHPSRIRPDNLTDLVFRWHLKHYMEHASSFVSDITASFPEDDFTTSVFTTPTRSGRGTHSTLKSPDGDQTPRPSQTRKNLCLGSSSTHVLTPHTLRGFTLSHLRRVPELAILAKRVVKAEASRRAAQSQPSSTSSTFSSSGLSRENKSRKMKRLFTSTLVKLHQEGLIILWDGTTWPLTMDPEHSSRISAGLWKDPSSKSSQSQRDKSSASASSTSVSLHSLNLTSVSTRDHDDGELSDPGPNETSYIPLTVDIMCDAVEDTIGTLVDEDRRRARTSRDGPPVLKGATKSTITARLRKSDEKWMHVGEWIVADTLVALKKQGRIWEVGNEKWEVCL